MKTLSWNDNWFIDVDDIDENNVTISGNSDTPNNVWVRFEAGVTPRTYIITYNDGERCLQQEVSAITPCSCTVTSYYTSSSAHTASAENEKFTVGTITETNCSCDGFDIARIEGDDLLHLEDSVAGLGVDKETGIIWALSGVSENTSSETRHVKYSISCDTCNGELVFYQKGTVVTCDCDAFSFEGTLETEGLSYFAKITNNTSSPINATEIGFDISGGGNESFHNAQVIAANSTAYYNNGNPICLEYCNNTYTTANISNFYIEIDDVQYTATCDKTIIGDGDTITLTYNG